MHTRTHGHPSIRYRHSDFQNLVAAEVTRLKPPGDQSLLTSAAAVFDAAPPSAAAFTRAELLITLAVLSLLVAIVLPALAHDRARSARIICVNNLRQIGVAMQMWGNDHNDRPPYYYLVAEGGTRLHPLAVNPWIHFSWISNELHTPRVLLCPSDTGNPATDFSTSATGGYLHPNFANRATSYFLAHEGGLRFEPQRHMSGDRNVGGGRAGGSSVFGVALRPDSIYWTPGLHHPAGNLLRNDGAVEQLSDEKLRATWRPDTSSLFEYIVPR